MQVVGSPGSTGSAPPPSGSPPPPLRSARTADSISSYHSEPAYVYDPPIEAVVFAWGVNEDGAAR